MKKGSTVVIALSVVAGVALVVATVLMIKGFSVAKTEQKARDNTKRNYENYFKFDPYPSSENIVKEKENLEHVKQWYDTLLEDLRKSNMPATNSNPVVFNGRRESVTADLLADAPIGADGTAAVPADFAFGFDDYRQGNLANPSDVPRLFRQLSMIELLTREIYASGTVKISSISREKFEKIAVSDASAGDFDSDRGRRRGRRRGGDDNAMQAEVQVDPLDSVPVKMDRQRFTFELLADESSIIEILNRFSRMNLFVVVTKLDVSKSGSDYKLAPDPAAEAEAAAKAAGKGGKNEVAVPVTPNPPPRGRTARLVAGRDLEAKLKVVLSVEVYSFDEDGEEKEGTK